MLGSRKLSPIAACLLALGSTVAHAPANAAENRRPNILFMFTDDQPQRCMGNSKAPTASSENGSCTKNRSGCR